MSARSAANPNFSIALIILAAIGSCLFTVAAGVLVYRSTSRVITANSWVEHTQEVLASLQTSTQYIDRAESNSRLFLSTNDEEQLNTARSAALRLQAMAVRLKDQVKDNAEQKPNLAAFEDCTTTLAYSLERLRSTRTLPRDELLHCRKTVNLMSEGEKNLLKQRTDASQANSSVSLSTDIGFATLSLALLSILFVFLLRDAFGRRVLARQTSAINRELAASVTALEEQALESRLLTAARDELQLCINLEQVYVSAARSIVQLIPGSLGALGMIDNSRHLVQTVSHWGGDSAASLLPDMFPPAACCGLRSGTLRWRKDGVSEVHCSHFRQDLPGSYLCIPMMAHGEAIGVLFVQVTSEAVGLLIERRLEGLRQVIQLIGMSIASLQLRLKLEHQSIRDPLTTLFNRHFMQITLEKELARCKRKRTSVGVLMLDVDHFKTFNDRFGHAAGDSVLQSVAAVLQSNVRTEDFVCRYGGEEFIIILPEIQLSAALHRAEAIRSAVAAVETTFGSIPGGAITISVGLALCSGEGSDPADIIRRADEALYQAKSQGRNRIVLFEAPTTLQNDYPLALA